MNDHKHFSRFIPTLGSLGIAPGDDDEPDFDEPDDSDDDSNE